MNTERGSIPQTTNASVQKTITKTFELKTRVINMPEMGNNFETNHTQNSHIASIDRSTNLLKQANTKRGKQ